MRRQPSVRSIAAVLTCLIMLVGSARGDEWVLYDDAQGSTPGAQPWLLYADDGFVSGGSANETAGGFGVNLATDNAVSAGYSNTIPIVNTFKNSEFPVLSRDSGFRLSFELQVLAETHVSNDRAGFSVILLADDTRGIELGFWEDRIWAQGEDPLFTQAEGAAFDTTASEVVYELAIFGDAYVLSADGNPLLNASLRDYSAFGGAPYTLGNYLFVGDNTSSAGADVNLGRITIATIPEPGSSLLLGVMGVLVLGRRASRRRRTV